MKKAKHLCVPVLTGKLANITEIFSFSNEVGFATKRIYLQLAGSGAVQVEEMIQLQQGGERVLHWMSLTRMVCLTENSSVKV